MPSGIRLQRIADRIRQELSEMLIREVADPRLEGVFVNDVKVDRELLLRTCMFRRWKG
jgi:ribosome-binding factor A